MCIHFMPLILQKWEYNDAYPGLWWEQKLQKCWLQNTIFWLKLIINNARIARRRHLKCSRTENGKNEIMHMAITSIDTFHNIYLYQNMTLYTINASSFVCQLEKICLNLRKFGSYFLKLREQLMFDGPSCIEKYFPLEFIHHICFFLQSPT